MDDRVLQFRVGVVVLAAMIITVILVMLFGEMPTLVRGTYKIHITFPEAPGVTKDTPVRKSGILIGRVTEVTLEDAGGVTVTADIDSKYKLRNDEICRIGTGSLLGDAVLEFVPSGKEGAAKTILQDGELIAGEVASNPLRVLVNLEGNIREAVDSIKAAGNEATALAVNLNAVVINNRDPLTRIMQRAETALNHFEKAMISVDGLVGDEELNKKLKKALEDVPMVLTESRATLESLRRAASSAEANLRNIEGLTKPLGDRGQDLVNAMNGSITKLDSLLGEMVAFSKSLNSSEGSLGKLINDPSLYQKIDRAASNIEEITRGLKPIIADVRIFTDKIARDPGVIGLKGALQKQQTGLKNGNFTRGMTPGENWSGEFELQPGEILVPEPTPAYVPNARTPGFQRR